MRVGLATIQYGRHRHLERQAAAMREVRGLARYLVVSMDDVAGSVGSVGPLGPMGAAGPEVLRMPVSDGDRLPLAGARNRAVAALADCDLVVLLDVDCVPSPGLVEAFTTVAESLSPERTIMLGAVSWLTGALRDGDPPAAATATLDKRGFPAVGAVREPRAELFWSLACALAPAAHDAVGGFDEGYLGWGAEDTDYGRRAQGRGVDLWKVAGAQVWHQPHPPTYRSPGQIRAVVDNARRFHRCWGDWPMPDVLGRLASAGAICWQPDGTTIKPHSDSDSSLGTG